MKFDQRLLAWMANQACRCDKEACLWMLEKGFFRSGEFVQRWCRLNGNILLYLKSASEMSEVLGAIVLEGFTVERDHLSEQRHAIRIANQVSGETYFIAAHSEREASDWVTCLRKASFGGQRSILADLRDRFMKLTGEDPLPSSIVLNLRDSAGEDMPPSPSPESDDAEVVLELTVACNGLSSPSEGTPPSTYVVTELLTPPQASWSTYSQTEICQANADPVYFSTIVLRVGAVSMLSRIRLTIYHVESSSEEVPDTEEQLAMKLSEEAARADDDTKPNGKPTVGGTSVIWTLGEACTTLGTIVNNAEPLLTLPVRPSTSGERHFPSVGEVCLQKWRDDAPGRPLSHYPTFGESMSKEHGEGRVRSQSVHHDSKGWAAVSNVVRATFRFPCIQFDRSIKAVELMGESMYAWIVPIQLLRIFIDEDRSLMLRLLDLRKLNKTFSVHCEALKADLQTTITYYTESINKLELLLSMEEMSFKPSRLKSEQRLEFVATNLHVQRIRLKMGNSLLSTLQRGQLPAFGEKRLGTSVSYAKRPGPVPSADIALPSSVTDPSTWQPLSPTTSAGEMEAVIDAEPSNPHRMQGLWEVITVGAPAAHSLKFKNGGLRRILQSMPLAQLQGVPHLPVSTSGGASSGEARLNAVNCREEHHKASRHVRMLQESFAIAEEKLQQAAQAHDRDALRDSMKQIEEKVNELECLCQSPSLHTCMFNLARGIEKEPEKGFAAVNNEWVWNGKEFVKSTSASTDVLMSCHTVQQHLLSLGTKVDTIVEKRNDFSETLQEHIDTCVCNLSTSLAATFQQLQAALTFSLVKEYVACPHIVSGLGGIRHRRDLCFSQALTSIITAFISHIELCSSNALNQFGMQLAQIGLLVHWESLLSTYGDELGMLEDMIIALDDIQLVQLRLEPMPDDVEIPAPHITGIRSSVDIVVPLKKDHFRRMPSELRGGQSFGIHVILFTQGVNETQLLADLGIKGGDSSLQDIVNHNSYSKMCRFFEKFREVFSMANSQTSEAVVEVKKLLDDLRQVLLAKQPRNIDGLVLSGKICRLMNGLRLTSCKSGKDRTAMSCTLEEVTLMKTELRLAPDNFDQALDVIRRGGTRLTNTEKNIGERRYAFNHMQLRVFPKLFRPPEGTFGSSSS